MRADPMDRIISDQRSAAASVSVPRIFAVGLVLPFAHPRRAYRRSTDLGTNASTFSIAVIVDLCILVLVMLWQASLGALVVRDSRSPAEIIDPAMFD